MAARRGIIFSSLLAKENINAGLKDGTFFLVTGGETKQMLDLRERLTTERAVDAPPKDLPD